MKRIIIALLCVLTLCGLCACGIEQSEPSSTPQPSNNSEIKINKNSDYFERKKVEEVTEQLSELGFKNIELISVEPKEKNDYNRVKGISIDSVSSFEKGDVFSADSLVRVEFYNEFCIKDITFSKAFHYKEMGTYPRSSDYTETFILINDDGKVLEAKHVHEPRHGDRYFIDVYDYELDENGLIKFKYKFNDNFRYFRVQEDGLMRLYESGAEAEFYDTMDLSSAMTGVRSIDLRG